VRIGGACALCAALLLGFIDLALAGSGSDIPGGRDNLYAVRFAAGERVWAAGAFGTILHSTDGARTWTRQDTPTQEMLFGVDFVNAQRGWTVGRSGLVLSTTDGGKTWSGQASGTERHLFSVDFADAQRGCAVGDWGTIITTSDGGVTWKKRDLANDVILNDVFMLEGGQGWVVGEAGILLSTEDGGVTWVEGSVGIEKTLFEVYFTTEQQGWAVGMDALILSTEDGGATWRVLHGVAEFGALDHTGFAHAFDNPSLYSITVVGDNGYAVGDMGAVFVSSDGGQIWTRHPVPGKSGLQWFGDVGLGPQGDGLIVGAGGLRLPIRKGRIKVLSE